MFRCFAIAALGFATVLGGLASTDTAFARGNRHAAFILDANSGAVLHAEDADALRHPASLTKMMTLYLTFETLEYGRLSLSDQVVMSEFAAAQAPSKLELDPGDTLSVADAIKALVTKSANDVAVALAEKIGGTEANFAKLMNKRARELGMTRTHFENASGLPDDAQVTTARDMVTLGLHLQDDFPKYYPLFAAHSFSYRGKSYRNHNTLLRTYQGVDGIKTGYTRASGFNLVSSVHRGKRHVVGAVFGGSSAASRNAEMRRLLTRALSRASGIKTRKPMYIARLKVPPRPAKRPPHAAKPALSAESPPRFAAARPEMPPASVAMPQNRTAPPPSAQRAAEPRSVPINIFKVRHVAVVPRPDETTDMAARDEDVASGGRVEPATYQIADASDPSRETAIAKTKPGSVPRLPSALGQQIAMLGGSTDAIQRGRAPSSLQAQAARLAQGQPPSRIAALVPSSAALDSAPRPSGRYEIQIGAYGTIADAQQALRSTQSKASRLLSGYASVTHPVTVGGKQIYRARFAGFDADRATRTCTELRRRSVDCFVMSAE